MTSMQRSVNAQTVTPTIRSLSKAHRTLRGRANGLASVEFDPERTLINSPRHRCAEQACVGDSICSQKSAHCFGDRGGGESPGPVPRQCRQVEHDFALTNKHSMSVAFSRFRNESGIAECVVGSIRSFVSSKARRAAPQRLRAEVNNVHFFTSIVIDHKFR